MGVDNPAQTLLWERDPTEQENKQKTDWQKVFTPTLWSHQLLQGTQDRGKKNYAQIKLKAARAGCKKAAEKLVFKGLAPTVSTRLPIFIPLNSSAVFQKCKSHILMWFDQQFYTTQPWPLSLSATHLYCWYAWLFYSVDHV